MVRRSQIYKKKLQFIKSKLKEWNKEAFGDLIKKKKNIFLDIAGLDEKEQEGNFSLELATRTLRNWKRNC